MTDAIHELMGGSTNSEARHHVDKIFDNMDTNADGKITIDEFVNYCNSHKDVRESMAALP